MAISYVNGFLCTSSCDVSKAKRGEAASFHRPDQDHSEEGCGSRAMRGLMDQPSSTAAR